MEKKTVSGKRRGWKIAGICLLSVVGLVLVLFIALQIVLTPAVLTNVANKYAPMFVDGDVNFGKVRVSVFKHFPNLNVSFDSLAITYPKEKFQEYITHDDWYSRQGRGEVCDTLLSVNRLSASVNLASLLGGQINVPRVHLSKPRIYATSYNDSIANWNIFTFLNSGPDQEEEDTVSSGLPDMVIGKIRLVDNPRVVFNSLPDSTNIGLSLKRLVFFGKIVTKDLEQSKLGLKVDTLFASARFPSDTMALKLDNLGLRGKDGGIEANALATAYLAMSSYGRMKLPISIDTRLSFPKDSLIKVSVERLEANFADIPLSAKADIGFQGDSILVIGNAAIHDCAVAKPIEYFGKNFMKEIAEVETDAVISLTAQVDGWLDSKGHIPDIDAVIEIPEAKIAHEKIGDKNKIGLKARVQGQSSGVVNVSVDELSVTSVGIALKGTGKAEDLLGKDPLLGVDGHFELDLDRVSGMLKEEMGYAVTGRLAAELKGDIRMSQMSMYSFANADLSGNVHSKKLVVYSEKDSVDVYIDSLDVKLGTFGNVLGSGIRKGERMMAVSGYVDSVRLRYKDQMSFLGRKVRLSAQNSAEILSQNKKEGAFYPFDGKFEAVYLSLKGVDTTSVSLTRTVNIFTVRPKAGSPDVPTLALVSKSLAASYRDPHNRLNMNNIEMKANAAMNSVERKKKARAFIDSLSQVYPMVPRDELFNHWRRSPMQNRAVPDWLSEEDFRKNDISINVSENIKKYFREWDIDGAVSLRRTRIISPLFPLRNNINNFKGSFDNDRVGLDRMTLVSGKSRLSASGEVTGLRRAILRNGLIKVDVDVASDSLDLNQLLAAFAKGSEFGSSELAGQDMSEMDDKEMEALVEMSDTTDYVDSQSLLVIPANLNADIKLNAKKVRYSKLELTSMAANLVVKERCAQFTNTSAMTNMGTLSFDGFYSSRTKKDLKAGFSLSMTDVTADKVIDMVPAIDTIMPLLKSFRGNLDLEVAATAAVDTSMNILPETINGIIRIGGKDLELENDQTIKKIAKLLKFNDKDVSHIDNMTVEGLLSDSQLEIFPFILGVDRYTLAMSGVQNLDSSFKYHVSLIESPLPFRLGLDLHGDFDDTKFKIGKAKYKSTNVPVFTAVVDEMKLNLLESIQNIFQKGVDEAVRENARAQAVNDYKKSISYVQAVDAQLDSLSTTEKESLELSEGASGDLEAVETEPASGQDEPASGQNEPASGQNESASGQN